MKKRRPNRWFLKNAEPDGGIYKNPAQTAICCQVHQAGHQIGATSLYRRPIWRYLKIAVLSGGIRLLLQISRTPNYFCKKGFK